MGRNIGSFGNIQIFVDEETEEGLYLRILVEEYPILGEQLYLKRKQKHN